MNGPYTIEKQSCYNFYLKNKEGNAVARMADASEADNVLRALNSHDALVTLVKRLTDSAECCVDLLPHAGLKSADGLAALCKESRATLTAAKGETAAKPTTPNEP